MSRGVAKGAGATGSRAGRSVGSRGRGRGQTMRLLRILESLERQVALIDDSASTRRRRAPRRGAAEPREQR